MVNSVPTYHVENFGCRATQADGAALERQFDSRGLSRAPAAQADLVILNRPSIAVLAFGNLTNDPEQEHFAHGMVEEIITALSRIKWLAVVGAPGFATREQAAAAWQVGRELGVRYVLEGSVRKSHHHVRITAELIETATGAHLWADRFDGLLEDVFELQDRVAQQLAREVT